MPRVSPAQLRDLGKAIEYTAYKLGLIDSTLHTLHVQMGGPSTNVSYRLLALDHFNGGSRGFILPNDGYLGETRRDAHATLTAVLATLHALHDSRAN